MDDEKIIGDALDADHVKIGFLAEPEEFYAQEIIVKLLPDEYGNYRPSSDNWSTNCLVYIDGELLEGAVGFYAGMSQDDILYCFNVLIVTNETNAEGFFVEEYRQYTCDRVFIERWLHADKRGAWV